MSPVQTHSAEMTSTAGRLLGWRRDAARLAAELLCQVSPSAADEVLDLRSALIDLHAGPSTVLKAFFAARNRLETEYYLHFYRLRRVLEPALEAEISAPLISLPPRRHPIDFRARDIASLRRTLQREAFEHDLNLPSPEALEFAVAWRF